MSDKTEYQNEVATSQDTIGVQAVQPWLLFRILKALISGGGSSTHQIVNTLSFLENTDQEIPKNFPIGNVIFWSIQNTGATTITTTAGVIPANDETVYTFPNGNNVNHESLTITIPFNGSCTLQYQAKEAI